MSGGDLEPEGLFEQRCLFAFLLPTNFPLRVCGVCILSRR